MRSPKLRKRPQPEFRAADTDPIPALRVGTSDIYGVAVVDLTNPAIPRHIATIATPGLARGIAISGPGELVVADAGGPGLTFIDTTDKTRPVIKGSQALPGNTVDVTVRGRTVFAASDQCLHTLLRP